MLIQLTNLYSETNHIIHSHHCRSVYNLPSDCISLEILFTSSCDRPSVITTMTFGMPLLLPDSALNKVSRTCLIAFPETKATVQFYSLSLFLCLCLFVFPLDNFSPLFSQIAILIWGYAFLNLIYISLMLSLLAERSFIQAEYRLKTVQEPFNSVFI